MRTRVYVDGFNLFYGALSKGPYKWLDLFALFQDHVLGSRAEVEKIFFYTAPIKASSADDPEAAARQQRYLRALAKHSGDRVVIREGFMIRSKTWQRLAQPLGTLAKGDKVHVFRFTEKQTDVNLAADLISDAWKGLYDQAVVCSSDTDLAGALAAVRRDHPSKRLGVVSPAVRAGLDLPHALTRPAHWSKVLSEQHLQDSQMPDKIAGTSLTRPAVWTVDPRDD